MRLFRVLTLSAPLVLGLMSACADAGSPADLDRTGPSFDLSADSAAAVATDSVKLVEVHWSDTVSYTVEKILDTKGGKLKIGSHEVFVPHGAVSSKTRFIWTATGGKYVEMELKAFRVSDGAPVTRFP